jgi:membrane-associated phospholipid phosphatase
MPDFSRLPFASRQRRRAPGGWLALVCALLMLGGVNAGSCQEASLGGAPAAADTDGSAPPAAAKGALGDVEAYFTAPLRWSSREWVLFGGALAGIGVAHLYDKKVRAHFVSGLGPAGMTSSDDVQDAIPTAAVLVGTFAFATLLDEPDGKREAWSMFEAAGLSTLTAYGLKYAVRRRGPDATSDPNAWGRGRDDSFPSTHATAAFAVGTVLAESGSDDFRWLRRLLGYGLGVATDYERLKHNAHWLSDVVAGSALGAASGYFVLNRHERPEQRNEIALVPVEGGAELTFKLTLN